MSFNQPHQRAKKDPEAIPPPPPSSPSNKTSKGFKVGKRTIIGVGVVTAMVALGAGATTLLSDNSEAIADYDEIHSHVSEIYETAAELLDDAGALEPSSQEALEEQLTAVQELLQADAPGAMTFGIADRTSELSHQGDAIKTATSDVVAAIDHRDSHTSAVSDGEDILADAEELLAETKEEVLDEDAYEQLSSHVSDLKEALDTQPDETSGQSYADATRAITSVTDEISGASSAVSASHDEWVESERDKENQDPANYKTISERDWQLVERDPEAYEGEKYVLYGAVTQADVMTGDLSIRVNTGPAQQSRRYNYDVNTILLVGAPDVFADVVQGDHVKMLVEVSGSMTYDTTIGGSASAVMALAYDVEVLGQF